MYDQFTFLPTLGIVMDIYQQTRIREFFSQTSHISQEACHKFVQDVLLAQLHSHTKASADVKPSLYQGSLSYTCIIDLEHPASAGEPIVVQFRWEELDLWGIIKANQVHGNVAPLVSFQGSYGGLFVYTSPFAPGKPYIAALMAAEQELPQRHRWMTMSDLADVLARGAKPPAVCLSHPSFLSNIQSMIDGFPFQNQDLKGQILLCLSEIRQNSARLTKLPLVLTHMDLTPFNYLIDETSGHITAILDWDGAAYLPIGHNFHFVENLLGYMTRDGWEDIEDRHALESFLFARVRQLLVSQGFDEGDLEAIEYEKALGILRYYVPKLLEWKDDKAERYLKAFLRHLSFLREKKPIL